MGTNDVKELNFFMNFSSFVWLLMILVMLADNHEPFIIHWESFGPQVCTSLTWLHVVGTPYAFAKAIHEDHLALKYS
jgi:hypothetical protein